MSMINQHAGQLGSGAQLLGSVDGWLGGAAEWMDVEEEGDADEAHHRSNLAVGSLLQAHAHVGSKLQSVHDKMYDATQQLQNTATDRNKVSASCCSFLGGVFFRDASSTESRGTDHLARPP